MTQLPFLDDFIAGRLSEAGWIATVCDPALVSFMRARITEDDKRKEDVLAEWDDEDVLPEWQDLPEATYYYSRTLSPSRSSREIDAKRRRLDQWRMAESALQHATMNENNSVRGYRDACYGAVLADANVYSDHADFKEQWKIS
jgi:hypothetical protein